MCVARPFLNIFEYIHFYYLTVFTHLVGLHVQSVQTQTVMTYGADYALGWCAFACLSYATIIYLARDHTCNVLGEPVLDPYLGGTSDDYKDLEPGKKADQGPMDDVFGPPAAGLYGNPALVGQAYGPTYGTYGPAGGASIAPYYGPTSIGLKPAQQYQYGQVHTHAHTLNQSENRVSVNLNHKECENLECMHAGGRRSRARPIGSRYLTHSAVAVGPSSRR